STYAFSIVCCNHILYFLHSLAHSLYQHTPSASCAVIIFFLLAQPCSFALSTYTFNILCCNHIFYFLHRPVTARYQPTSSASCAVIIFVLLAQPCSFALSTYAFSIVCCNHILYFLHSLAHSLYQHTPSASCAVIIFCTSCTALLIRSINIRLQHRMLPLRFELLVKALHSFQDITRLLLGWQLDAFD